MNPLNRCIAFWQRQAMLVKATSFALVGVVNTAIDLAVFLAAYNLLELTLIPANVLAWFVAVSCSYVMNSTITFAAESGRKLRWRDYGTFVASGVVGVIANTATLVLASYVRAGVGGEADGDRRELPGQFLDVAFRGVPEENSAVIVREGGRSSTPGDH